MQPELISSLLISITKQSLLLYFSSLFFFISLLLLCFTLSLLPLLSCFFFLLPYHPDSSLPSISTDYYPLLHLCTQHTYSFAPVDLGCLRWLTCTLLTLLIFWHKKISAPSLFLYNSFGKSTISLTYWFLILCPLLAFWTSEHLYMADSDHSHLCFFVFALFCFMGSVFVVCFSFYFVLSIL